MYYVIIETKDLAGSAKNFNQLFGPIIQRIEIILEELSKRSPTLSTLVETIRTDVFEQENLSPYWEKKLHMLVEIEAI